MNKLIADLRTLTTAELVVVLMTPLSVMAATAFFLS